MLERIGVVIPAHNEEALLADCLASMRAAVDAVPTDVHVVVVLDRCTDGSATIAHRHRWVDVVSIDAGNVGRARAAGARRILECRGAASTDALWLATTDADSRVPSDWLVKQQRLADAGWDAVLGTVDVLDWSDHDCHVAPRWQAAYQSVEGHPHIHGANFGCAASAYLDVGGWPPLAADEDVAMVAALAHHRVIRTASLPVITSARRDPRATGGFGDTLLGLAG